MRRTAVVFEARRTGYAISDVSDSAMTIRELIGYLEMYDDDDIVIISHDNGYTYGSLSYEYDTREDEDGEFEERSERW